MLKTPIFRPALFFSLIAASASLVTHSQAPSAVKTGSESLTVSGEKHLGNARQLTFGGTNAEAYFSADDKSLIFMHSGAGVPCDQMYTMPVDTPDSSDLHRLTNSPGSYNAESTISRDGKKIVFTSTRNGDLDIFTMNSDGSDVRQLTHELGYDGGAFFSDDGKKIVYRSEQPKTPEQIADYKDLLSRGLIRPGNLEIWVMDADGKNKRQITHNGAANFAPYWLPDGKRIIFASNVENQKDPSGFDLYLINEDGTGLNRVTYHPDFDAFPMFSSNGKRLVWASNRNGKAPHETNIFIADWVE